MSAGLIAAIGLWYFAFRTPASIRLPEDAWADPNDLERWLLEHHPYWAGMGSRPQRAGWVRTFLLGLAYQLRMLQAARDSTGEWVVRLSPLGRGLLGISAPPTAVALVPQTPWRANPPRRETRASATTTPGNRTVRHPGR